MKWLGCPFQVLVVPFQRFGRLAVLTLLPHEKVIGQGLGGTDDEELSVYVIGIGGKQGVELCIRERRMDGSIVEKLTAEMRWDIGHRFIKIVLGKR